MSPPSSPEEEAPSSPEEQAPSSPEEQERPPSPVVATREVCIPTKLRHGAVEPEVRQNLT